MIMLTANIFFCIGAKWGGGKCTQYQQEQEQNIIIYLPGRFELSTK